MVQGTKQLQPTVILKQLRLQLQRFRWSAVRSEAVNLPKYNSNGQCDITTLLPIVNQRGVKDRVFLISLLKCFNRADFTGVNVDKQGVSNAQYTTRRLLFSPLFIELHQCCTVLGCPLRCPRQAQTYPDEEHPPTHTLPSLLISARVGT